MAESILHSTNVAKQVPPAWISILAVAATLLAPAHTAALQPSAPSGATVVAKVIPWLEVNAPKTKVARWFPKAARSQPNMSMRDYALEGIELWAKVPDIIDTVIISSRPEQIDALYPYLMRNKPHSVRIVGGLKTFSLPGVLASDTRPYGFSDADGWRRIADWAREVARITKTNIVLLDNETTLMPFTRGEVTIDYDRLKTSLAALRETGIVFWWNLPRILGDTPTFPDRRAQTERLVVAIHQALPTSVFLNGYTAWYDPARDPKLQETMTQKVGPANMQDRLLVTPDGFMHYPGGRRKRCFTAAEAVTRIRKIKGENVSIYSGGAFWVSVAGEFVHEWKKTAPP